MRAWLGFALLTLSFSVQAQPLPIFDAHMHRSHVAWSSVPVEQAIAMLRKAGIRKALVSSAGDEGQQRLYRAAPDLIVPGLRPYRMRGLACDRAAARER